MGLFLGAILGALDGFVKENVCKPLSAKLLHFLGVG